MMFPDILQLHSNFSSLPSCCLYIVNLILFLLSGASCNSILSPLDITKTVRFHPACSWHFQECVLAILDLKEIYWELNSWNEIKEWLIKQINLKAYSTGIYNYKEKLILKILN